MADLSTLDATAPSASDPVSQGDDAIRDTRAAILGSFGGTDSGAGTAASEHYLKGMHKFPNGAQGARPAAGNAGRIYLNTTDQRLEWDNGTLWALLNAIPVATQFTAAGVSVTTSYVSTLSLTLDIPTGARLVVLASFDCNATAGASDMHGQFLVNGVAILADEFRIGFGTSSAMAHTWWSYSAAPATGAAVPVALQVKHVSSGGAALLTNRRLLAALI